MKTRLRILQRGLLMTSLAALCACDISQAGCEQTPLAPEGDLGRLGDAVIVTPDTDDDELRRSFVVVSNPEAQQLRIFDVRDRSFLRAPNRYFPLSVHTGPATHRLATTSSDPTRLYALDGVADTLTVVSMALLEGSAEPSFSVENVIDTGRAPGDLAAAVTVGGVSLVFVTLPEESALQVIDVDAGAELARVDLGAGSRPAQVAVDPSADAVVVTAASLSSVAVVRLEDLTLDRRIEVGGPTDAIATGRVNPGDGTAPVALVGRRDAPEVVALRLYRPGYREERYERVASAELPGFASALYVSDSADETAVPCCAAQFDVGTERPDATWAWGSVATADGFLFYLRFDAERGPVWDGTELVPAEAGASALELMDNGTPAPGPQVDLATAEVWFPSGEAPSPRPTLAVDAVDNRGDVPHADLWPVDLTLTLVYEGSPRGTYDRRASLGSGDVVSVLGGSVPLAERDVRDGDVILVDLSGRGAGCPDLIERPASDFDGDTFVVGGLSDGDRACLQQGGEFRFILKATASFTIQDSRHGYVGRVEVKAGGASLEIPDFVVTVAENSDGAPTRASRFIVELDQNRSPVVVQLSRQPDFNADGYGLDAMLANTMVADRVRVACGCSDTEICINGSCTEAEGAEPRNWFDTNRLFLATGAGALIEMAEGEININYMARHR
jgi:hypothetical protein